MHAWVKTGFWVGLVVLVVMQIVRPQTANPAVDPSKDLAADVTVPAEITDMFVRPCNDCYSNRTVWPWYSHVAPVSWLVVSDVIRGRRRVNFSEWRTYASDKRSKLLQAICKEVTEGGMPPLTYTPMHSSAPLTKGDAQEICRWTAATRQTIAASDGVKP